MLCNFFLLCDKISAVKKSIIKADKTINVAHHCRTDVLQVLSLLPERHGKTTKMRGTIHDHYNKQKTAAEVVIS